MCVCVCVCDILLNKKITSILSVFYNFIYLFEGKAEFLAALIHSSVSHDSSKINLIC